MLLEHGMILVAGLSLLSVSRRQVLWAILLVAGAVIEISAVSFSAAFSGAGLIALSSAALARRKTSVVVILFASVFLLLLGGAILAAHARTEDLAMLRVELGSASSSLARAVMPLLWIGLMLRVVVLPLWLSRVPSEGTAITVGPGWLSALIVAQHLSTIWPQAILMGCTSICVNVGGLYAALMGLAAIQGRREGDWLCFVASGVGMIALISAWFGAETGPVWGQSTVLKTGALLLLLRFVERRTVPLSVQRAMYLALLGFPLTGLYVDKRGILEGLSQFGVIPQLGALIIWVVPLVAVFAGGHSTTSERRWIPTVAQAIALVVAVLVSLEGGMVWRD